MAKLSEAIDLTGVAAGLPSRIHEIIDRHVACSPDRIALIEDGVSWSYRELGCSVADIAAGLKSLGVRAGDRMIIVSENCIALAALLLAASRIDAWAIVATRRAAGHLDRQDPQAQARAAPARRITDTE
jgi:long-chain acyl-CoA synthetase